MAELNTLSPKGLKIDYVNRSAPKRFICKMCNIEKDISQFYLDGRIKNKNILSWRVCRPCCKTKNKNDYKANPLPAIKRAKEWKNKNKSRYMYNQYSYWAKDRGYEFMITFEQFSSIIKKPCHYCGKAISFGVDRKNNKEGYRIKNCLPCCTECNIAKACMTYSGFINWVGRVYKNFYKNGDK